MHQRVGAGEIDFSRALRIVSQKTDVGFVGLQVVDDPAGIRRRKNGIRHVQSARQFFHQIRHGPGDRAGCGVDFSLNGIIPKERGSQGAGGRQVRRHHRQSRDKGQQDTGSFEHASHYMAL